MDLDNIPKAEDFYNLVDDKGEPLSFNEKMIIFASMHVQAAKIEIAENFKLNSLEGMKESILNAYPLENIQ